MKLKLFTPLLTLILCACANQASVALTNDRRPMENSVTPVGAMPDAAPQPGPGARTFGQDAVTGKVGNIRVSTKWRDYGAYLQRVVETVQKHWAHLLADSNIHPPPGGTVTVKFILTPQGEIAKIADVENNSTDEGARACVASITDPGAFGPWTPDMKAVLGDEQEIAFTFQYQ